MGHPLDRYHLRKNNLFIYLRLKAHWRRIERLGIASSAMIIMQNHGVAGAIVAERP